MCVAVAFEKSKEQFKNYQNIRKKLIATKVSKMFCQFHFCGDLALATCFAKLFTQRFIYLTNFCKGKEALLLRFDNCMLCICVPLSQNVRYFWVKGKISKIVKLI